MSAFPYISLQTWDAVPLTAEVLNNIEISGMPAHEIRLKAGAPVLFMANLDPPRAVNGTLCVAKNPARERAGAACADWAGSRSDNFCAANPTRSPTDSGLGFSFRGFFSHWGGYRPEVELPAPALATSPTVSNQVRYR